MFVKDMAQLIVERATLINHLLPQDDQRTELAEHVLTAMIDMFYVYLIKAQLPQIEAAFQWVCTVLPMLCSLCLFYVCDVTKCVMIFTLTLSDLSGLVTGLQPGFLVM